MKGYLSRENKKLVSLDRFLENKLKFEEKEEIIMQEKFFILQKSWEMPPRKTAWSTAVRLKFKLILR